MTNETEHPIPDDSGEERPSIDWEKSIVATIAIGAGILAILALVALVALALLGPAIGQVYTSYGGSL